MSDLLTGALSVLLATNQPVALSNFVEQTTGIKVEVPNPNDPVQRELREVFYLDDSVRTEINAWVDSDENISKSTGVPSPTLDARIRQKLQTVRDAYEAFLKKHPTCVEGHVAYASFLEEIADEMTAGKHLEKAYELDPNNPVTLNNLANFYGHNSPVEKAFDLYEKAISLRPQEAVYYHNYGTTVYLFRRHAMTHFKITEQQVFDKALQLYAKALELDPKNFALATDVAKTFYGIEPKRPEAALKAWQIAYGLAADEKEKQGVRIHFARWEMHAGNFDKAREWLTTVQEEDYLVTKTNVLKTIARKEAEAKSGKATKPEAPKQP
jgi:tetratricopeptide (TPR) repeat protein